MRTTTGGDGDREVDDVDDLENDFESDIPTPVVSAAGTRDDLGQEAARAARLATEPGHPEDDVASLAHDLKNPLTIIMLEANQIEQRLGLHATPGMLRSIERISQNAEYVDRLVSDLLDVASSDAGRLDLRIERLDLARLVKTATDRCVGTPQRTRIHIDIRDVVFALGDEIRIERVISNLITNAFKYCDTGYVTIRVEQRDESARVSVIDTGPGLNAEEARRVFERYRRGATGSQQGYGLGLYTSRKIIEAHRGRIGCESTPGRGCRFFFELPIASKQSTD